jgi:hypothetical protein
VSTNNTSPLPRETTTGGPAELGVTVSTVNIPGYPSARLKPSERASDVVLPTLRADDVSRRVASRWRQIGRVGREILFVAFLYIAYSASRLLARTDEDEARTHGTAIFHAEGFWATHVEQPLNAFATRHAWVGGPPDWYYATAHYAWTLLLLVWLWRRHPEVYNRARNSLAVITLTGLVVFILFPVAPPRLLTGLGYHDAMSRWSDFGYWGAGASAPRGAESLTNQYAAMPSLHVAWALWCGWWSFQLATSSRSRITSWVHPAITAVVVIITANHYSLDVVGGVAAWGVGMLATLAVPALVRAARPRLAGKAIPDLVWCYPGFVATPMILRSYAAKADLPEPSSWQPRPGPLIPTEGQPSSSLVCCQQDSS